LHTLQLALRSPTAGRSKPGGHANLRRNCRKRYSVPPANPNECLVDSRRVEACV